MIVLVKITFVFADERSISLIKPFFTLFVVKIKFFTVADKKKFI